MLICITAESCASGWRMRRADIRHTQRRQATVSPTCFGSRSKVATDVVFSLLCRWNRCCCSSSWTQAPPDSLPLIRKIPRRSSFHSNRMKKMFYLLSLNAFLAPLLCSTAVGEQLFNLIPAGEEVRAKNKNFKVHKFMWKILGCSFYIFLISLINYTFLSRASLGWVAGRAEVL